MELVKEEIEQYAEAHTTPETELLAALNRETYEKVLNPRMLSGHLQGRMLSLFSRMKRPQFILEIGTYTGYSALCLAEGLQPGGVLHTIDINDELGPMVKRYIKKAERGAQIITHLGHGFDIIPGLDFRWDMVFIDADKENYSAYYDLVFERVNRGGVILADNVLWSGKVCDPNTSEHDEETKALQAFNRKVVADSRAECVLLPVRDGLMCILKK